MNAANQNLALSYFTGLDTYEELSVTMVAGDRNIGGGQADDCASVAPLPGVPALELTATDPTIRWTNSIHGLLGNIAVCDGSVQKTRAPALRAIAAEAYLALTSGQFHTATGSNESSESKIDTPLWDTLARVSAALVPAAQTVPFIMVAATDARFFRRAGATCYGFGLQSGRIPYDELSTMFHGDNERIDTESLYLCTELWEALARDFLG